MIGKKQEHGHRFAFLDALRGVAACAVLLFHLRSVVAVPHGYLAVDFFFVLSGFVISHAYQSRLDSGAITLSQFILARVFRLYPLYIASLAIGVAFDLLQIHFGAIHHSSWKALSTFALGAVFLPTPAALSGGGVRSALFPFNVVAWSLMCEMLANLIHAVAGRKRSNLFFLIALVIALAYLVYTAHAHGSLDLGSLNADWTGGIARVAFSYLCGIMLFRVWRSDRFVIHIWQPIIVAILIGVLCAPIIGGYLFDLVTSVLVFPLLILAGATVRAPSRAALRRLYASLGALSYALYILQLPLLQFLERTSARSPWFVAHIDSDPTLRATLFAALVLGIASAADVFYDVPVRRLLRDLEHPEDKTTIFNGRT